MQQKWPVVVGALHSAASTAKYVMCKPQYSVLIPLLDGCIAATAACFKFTTATATINTNMRCTNITAIAYCYYNHCSLSARHGVESKLRRVALPTVAQRLILKL
jgi:hypothetical protein